LDAPYNWLADFDVTDSDLQIISYPTLFPIIDFKGNLSIDPFSSAPAVSPLGPLPSFEQSPAPKQPHASGQATPNAGSKSSVC
jgi:hypothetical protein